MQIHADRVRELAGDDNAVASLAEPLLAVLATMLREFAKLTRQALDIARKDEEGQIVALTCGSRP